MAFFLEQMRFVLPLLGVDILKTREEPQIGPDGEEESLWIMNEVGAHAMAIEDNGEFLVKAGSTAQVEGTPFWRSDVSLRDSLVSDGLFAPSDDPNIYVFTEDVLFSVPSAASSVIRAANSNGYRARKRSDNKMENRDWMKEKIDATPTDDDSGDFKWENTP